VALNATHALTQASDDDSRGNDIGRAYLFDLASGILLHTYAATHGARAAQEPYSGFLALVIG